MVQRCGRRGVAAASTCRRRRHTARAASSLVAVTRFAIVAMLRWIDPMRQVVE
jgi:hypothetical protein